MIRKGRVFEISCCRCGKKIDAPYMFSSKERNKLHPFCATTTIAISQWLMKHGWHVTRFDTIPSNAYICDDCYKGEPEYLKSIHCDEWCEQMEEWIKTGDIQSAETLQER